MSKENQIRVVAVSTVFSRLTGFFRDVLVFAVFGTSAINSAFIIAFTIPNLFRRFMGEGALTSALVPALAHEQAKNGKSQAFELFNKVMTRATMILVSVVLLGIVFFEVLQPLTVQWKLEERWTLAMTFGSWVFPYLIFVCLAALIGAALNLQKKFASTALAQIWVNLTMALALVIGVWMTSSELTRMMWLCGGVLVGGALQLLLPGYALTREGWRPQWDTRSDKAKLNEMWGMFGPGLLGATVAQIDTAVSQLLAFGLNDAATSVLFLANRIMQLPLGVFAIAVTTVTFPMIARKAAEGDKEGFALAYRDSSTLIQAVMIPAGVGLALLAEPILVSFFKWGSFDANSVRATVPILITYALGIPFFAGTTLTTRALHSLKDMKTPVKWGIVTLTTNLILSLILKEIWGTLGLALSNILSTALFAWGLRQALKKKVKEVRAMHSPVVKLMAAAGLMVAVVLPLLYVFPHDKMGRFLAMIVGAPVGVAVYAVALHYLSKESFLGLKKLVWK